MIKQPSECGGLPRHHHLIGDQTGQIHDVAWNQVEVRNIKSLGNFEVNEYQVVMHGRRKRPKEKEKS